MYRVIGSLPEMEVLYGFRAFGQVEVMVQGGNL
jgi:hypothetical protein